MPASVFLSLLFAAAVAVAGDIPRPEYPRPQFVRDQWHNLNGSWTCELDLDEATKATKPGQADAAKPEPAPPADRRDAKGFSQPITVPFCPESRLSGIGHTGFIPQIWYHRPLEIPADWNDRILLHFGGVDYHCECYIDGRLVGRHAGGQAGFAFDIAPFVKPGGRHDLVLRVRDDVRSGLQPAGKQSQAIKSAGCHYTRVTGIWQTVWMEPVPRLGLRDFSIVPDFDRSRFSITPAYWAVAAGHTLRATLLDAGREVSSATVPQADGVPLALDVPDPKPWSPESPHLYDLRLELLDAKGTVIDTVGSYAGLRKVHLENGRFHLNNRPIFLRLVLDQGYYPDGVWTAPDDAALRQGIELSQAAGFNGARLHQKVFEPRFHFWADRLGYLTWGEAASWGCNAAKPEARDNFLREWREIVDRDRNHPSIIAWTPWNEVWATDANEQIARTLRETFALTRALDPTRPVHTSSGGAHVATDIFSVHCYEQTGPALAAVLAAGEDATLAKVQRAHAEALTKTGLPLFVGEFGGIKWNTPGSGAPPENWGYGDAPKDKEAFLGRLDDLVNTVLAVPGCAGYCYTQITDVEQEVNGIYTYDRHEKFDMHRVRAAFSREPAAAALAAEQHTPGRDWAADPDLVPPSEPADMQRLFDGMSLAGWDGDPRLWSVRDGVIHGETTPEQTIRGNSFLIWTGGEVADFDLRLSFRASATNNSGIQYRSRRITDASAKNQWVVRGFQHEIRNQEKLPNVSGFIYDEGGTRQRVCLAGEKAVWHKDGGKELLATLIDHDQFAALMRVDEWNDVVIRAEGNRVRHYLNGRLILDFTDEDPDRVQLRGVLALQLHDGRPTWAEYRNIRLKAL